MAKIIPFSCIRPQEKLASQVAALPYDVYNRKEACEVVQGNPLSFLNIDRAETQFDASVDTYADIVYDKAREMLDANISNGTYIQDEDKVYYIYQLIMNGRSQTGIVACASIDDYLNNVIKKHENTRADKELDRIHHVDRTSAQTGPIFLAYRRNEVISDIIHKYQTNEKPINDFTKEDGVTHRVWKISMAEDVTAIEKAFAAIDRIYIADGHHRAASAVKVGLRRREAHPDYNGTEEFNYFLSVLFADEELMIMPYNRVVKDLNGLSEEAFLSRISEDFEVVKKGKEALYPESKGSFGMYMNNEWYLLTAKPSLLSSDPVKGLDVAILQDNLLTPVLGIGDPRTDKRIDFIGGIRGLSELEKRCREDMQLAFSMYPTSISELFSVADADLLMPPKSTWFEPKLRSGLFIHRIEE